MGLKETFSWESFLTLSVPGYSTLTFGFFNFFLTSRPRRQCIDSWCQRGSQRNKSLSVYWCFGLDGRKKLHNPKRQYTNVFARFKQGLSLIGEKISFGLLWLVNTIPGVHEPFWLVRWDSMKWRSREACSKLKIKNVKNIKKTSMYWCLVPKGLKGPDL